MKENSKLVLNYCKEHNGENFTATDIAEATGLSVRAVNGIVTSAFCRKEYAVRVPAEVKLADDTHKAVKFIRLTEKGLNLDPNAEDA